MNKKLLIWIFTLFIFCSFAFAIIEPFPVNVGEYISRFASNGTTSNAIGNYNNLNESFFIQPPQNQTWIIARLLVQIRTSGKPLPEQYGDQPQLTNGVIVQANQSGNIVNFTNGNTVMNNGEWAAYAFDTELSIFGGTDNFVNVRWSFWKSGTYVLLNGSNNDKLEVILDDDFTGLVGHTFLFQGYVFNSSRISIQEEREEPQMLAIIYGISVVMALFILLGFKIEGTGLRTFFFGFALIQAIQIFFLLYLNELGNPLSETLRINFIVTFLISTAIALVSLYALMVRLMTPGKGGELEELKWQRR